jgi:hypothetical protein
MQGTDPRMIKWRWLASYEALEKQVLAAIQILRVSQGCMGVLEPAGVFAPGVAESVPAFFFFFFLRGMRAGGFIRALRSDK